MAGPECGHDIGGCWGWGGGGAEVGVTQRGRLTAADRKLSARPSVLLTASRGGAWGRVTGRTCQPSDTPVWTGEVGTVGTHLSVYKQGLTHLAAGERQHWQLNEREGETGRDRERQRERERERGREGERERGERICVFVRER